MHRIANSPCSPASANRTPGRSPTNPPRHLSRSHVQRVVVGKIAVHRVSRTGSHVHASGGDQALRRELNYAAQKTIADVFTEVSKSRADYGVVPVENSTEGVVTHTLDMFVDSDLKIVSQIVLKGAAMS